MTIHIYSGLPASGKSTLAAQHIADDPDNSLYFSRDKWRDYMRGVLNSADYFPFPSNIERRLWYAHITDTIDRFDYEHIHIDQTTITQKAFKSLVAHIRFIYNNANIILHQLTTDFDTCLERNAVRQHPYQVPLDAMHSLYAAAIKDPISQEYCAKHDIKVIRY